MKKKIVLGSHESAARSASGAVVIIDVFRAFTTGAVALSNGAEKIVMVEDLSTALSLRKQNSDHVCMGERGGDRPEGFEFGNSPAEILNHRFDGKTVIQTTSNGTRGVLAASAAQEIYAGSFVNADATVAALLASDQEEITLVAMGNGVERTDEDEMCALYMRSRLLGLKPSVDAIKTVLRTMSKRVDGKALTEADVACCLDFGRFPFAIKVQSEAGLVTAKALAV